MAKRSDQQVALGRRPALATAALRLPRIGRIDGLRGVAEVLQYPLDDGRREIGDHIRTGVVIRAGLCRTYSS